MRALALKKGLAGCKKGDRCNVIVSMALRVRYRSLTSIQKDSPAKFEGITGPYETSFRKLCKGHQNFPCRRGKAQPCGLLRESNPVMVAQDQAGPLVDGVLFDQKSASITQILGIKVGKDNVPCIDSGNALGGLVNSGITPCKVASSDRHVHQANPVFLIQKANAYCPRSKVWMSRFRGVLTKHLPSYLGWRRIIETPRRIVTSTGWIPMTS